MTTSTFPQLIALSTVALCLVALPVRAEQQEAAPGWDQKKVSALAQELSDAADALNKELNNQRGQLQVGSGQSRAMLQFRDDIRVARNESRRLAKVLGEGQTREETTPAYRRLMSLVRDARETGRKLMLHAPATDYIAKANAALDGLAPYYPDIKPSRPTP